MYGAFNNSSYFSHLPQQLTKVSGIESAKAYQLAPNSQAALFNDTDDILYIKTTDSTGFSSIRTFRFAEVTESKQESSFITKDEFDEFRKEMKNYAEQFISKFNTENTVKSDADAEPVQRVRK